MIAVIFEVWPKLPRKQDYLNIAAELKPLLENIDGFISIERFESLYEPGKILSLSFFRDEAAVKAWRNTLEHRKAQAKGRHEIFAKYRLRVASVIRDYGMDEREQVPADSRAVHKDITQTGRTTAPSSANPSRSQRSSRLQSAQPPVTPPKGIASDLKLLSTSLILNDDK